jgi:alpha-L-arabinofuranosidase
MANNYKFKGVNLSTQNETSILTAGTKETIIIKSLKVTNNTGNTPNISFDVLDSSSSVEVTILNTQSLSANNSVEILTQPLVLETSDVLKATVSTNDNINIGISYLTIS